MVNIAIVEDNQKDADNLLECLQRYADEKNEQFSFKHYKDANTFLEEKEQTFDIVYLDIMLPGITGMEAAKYFRKVNSQTVLFFVTSTASCAMDGYEVDAIDYILKPVSYKRIAFKLGKALKIVEAAEGKIMSLNDKSGRIQISTNEIYYVEIRRNKLTYHTTKGEYTEIGSLKALKEELASLNFVRCNSCYLVNLKYVFRVKGLMLTVSNGDELKISQPKRKAFMGALANYAV